MNHRPLHAMTRSASTRLARSGRPTLAHRSPTSKPSRHALPRAIGSALGFALALGWFASAVPSTANAGWYTVPSGTTGDLEDLVIFNGATIMACGEGGTILRSEDWGATWSALASGSTTNLSSIDVHTSNQWWAGGDDGTVLVSTNAGTSWNYRPAPTSARVHLFSRSGGVSWAVGDDGRIHKTTNQGVDWTAQSSGTTAALHAGDGFSAGVAHAVGNDGTILRSANGIDWAPISSGTTSDLYSYIEPGNRLVAGSGGTILKSTDAGLTWHQKVSGTTEDLFDIRVSAANGSWISACGANGTLIKSTDAGETWCQIPTGVSEDLYAVLQLNQQITMAIGEGGLILRTEDGGGPCLSPSDVLDADMLDTSPREKAAFYLSPVVPNPSHEGAAIQLRVRDTQSVRARLIDMAGRTRATLLEETLSGGDERTISIDTSSLPSGSYILAIDGPRVATSRMVRVVR